MEANYKIRVLIVDDHAMIRYALRVMFESFDDIEVVAETGDARTTLTLCETYEPDVVIMDLLMPYLDGVAATRLIRNEYPDTQVIALSSFAGEKLIVDVLQAGAISYIQKTESVEGVVKAVREAFLKRPTLSPEVANMLTSHSQFSQEVGWNLSDQEREILALMVEGLSNEKMGERLDISVPTLKHYTATIFSKLHTFNRTQTVDLSVRNKLHEKQKPTS